MRVLLRNSHTKTELKYQPKEPPTFGRYLGNAKIGIKRYFTDTSGLRIAKGTLPANLQTDIPYFLFNNYDRDGGYFQFQKSFAGLTNWKFITSQVAGFNTFRMFQGVNNIQDKYFAGDIILVYTDNIKTPSYYCWVVMTMDQKSLGSFTNHFPKLFIDGFFFSSDNDDNYYNPLVLLKIDEMGEPTDQKATPNTDLTPENENLVNVYVPLKWRLNTNQGIGGLFLFDTETITLSLKLKVKNNG